MKVDVSRLLEGLAVRMKEARTERDRAITSARRCYEALERESLDAYYVHRSDAEALSYAHDVVKHSTELICFEHVLREIQRQLAEEMQK